MFVTEESYPMENRKLVGILSFILGTIGIVTVFLIDSDKLVFVGRTDPFIVKYFLVIGIINCGVYFVVYGGLQFFGFILPYYARERTKLDSAKNIVCGIGMMIPVLISGTATLFVKSENLIWKGIWICFVFYLIVSFFNGIKILVHNRMRR